MGNHLKQRGRIKHHPTPKRLVYVFKPWTYPLMDVVPCSPMEWDRTGSGAPGAVYQCSSAGVISVTSYTFPFISLLLCFLCRCLPGSPTGHSSPQCTPYTAHRSLRRSGAAYPIGESPVGAAHNSPGTVSTLL